MSKSRVSQSAKKNQHRRIDAKRERKFILILCEGKATEPNYFNALVREKRLRGCEVIGTGVSGMYLINDAKSRQKQEDYDEIWCVFDKDSLLPEDFNTAIQTTRNHPFLHAVWSNEAFELWYVLHFEYLNSSTGRQYYLARLKALLGGYRKAQPNMYTLLKARMETAQSHAQKLVAEYTDETPFHDRIPCTTVYELVARLEEYAAEKPY